MQNTSDFWPENIQGAISLTFDDNAQSQLNNALPCLDDHRLKGTFYVNPGRKSTWKEDLPRWQQASQNGHEMGNHTIDHPCSCNFGFRKDGYCLEKLALADIEDTIDRATEAMNDLFPEQAGDRSFCYPCYQAYVGSGENRQSYVPVVARRFKVARGGGERPNNPRVIDLSYIWSFSVQGHSGADMIAYTENAVEQGWWGVICMHGVGGDHIAIETSAFRDLCAYLDQNRHRIWTDTIIHIADYVIQRRETAT
ncbi:MAG: polysaccharide deacetylase family protein [bacterium]|nr:polysaccharide deacetylase family protein [bacterium]